MSDPSKSARTLTVHRLGRVEYADGLKLQQLQSQALGEGLVGDGLLLLEHPPVFTFGRSAKAENLLRSTAQLEAQGFRTFETARGGDVTYHGPGQLVGYPILELEGDRRDVRRYVRGLEEVLIRTLADVGVKAFREPRWPGVWTERGGALEKVAALGVHIAKWRTGHGFALNLDPNLSHFDLIVPCGIREAGVTSVARLLGRKIDRSEVEPSLVRHFAEVFEYPRVARPAPMLQTVSVTVVARSSTPPKPELSSEPRVLCLHRIAERGGFWQLVTGKIEAGETASAAALRELYEETGRALPVRDLGYRHAFALGDALPPQIVEETAFAAEWNAVSEPALDPREHDQYDWVSPPEALARLPFEGLREAVRRAVGNHAENEEIPAHSGSARRE